MFRGRFDEITMLSFGPPDRFSFGHIRAAHILRSDVQLLLHTSTSSSGEAGFGVGKVFLFISHWIVGCVLSHPRTETVLLTEPLTGS
jgi:hypothetical protein